MGQCGCGDYSAEIKIKGPDNAWYAIEMYAPCDYCETPAGITIYLMKGDDIELWDVNHLPEFTFEDDCTLALPVVDPQILESKMRKKGHDLDKQDDKWEYEYFAEHCMETYFFDSVIETWGKYLVNLRKRMEL